MALEQSDGADTFYFTPFTSGDAWTQSKGDAYLYHDDVILAPSIEQSGEATSEFLLSPYGAPIKIPIIQMASSNIIPPSH